MNYQTVRAALETPLITAFNALVPAVPVYCDNVINYDADAVDEFVHVNIQFGITTETALTANHEYIRGVIVVRTHTQKGQGAGRNQTLTKLVYDTLNTLNDTPKTANNVYLRLGAVDGPTFSPDFGGSTPDQETRRAFTPYFISRLETRFQARSFG